MVEWDGWLSSTSRHAMHRRPTLPDQDRAVAMTSVLRPRGRSGGDLASVAKAVCRHVTVCCGRGPRAAFPATSSARPAQWAPSRAAFQGSPRSGAATPGCDPPSPSIPRTFVVVQGGQDDEREQLQELRLQVLERGLPELGEEVSERRGAAVLELPVGEHLPLRQCLCDPRGEEHDDEDPTITHAPARMPVSSRHGQRCDLPRRRSRCAGRRLRRRCTATRCSEASNEVVTSKRTRSRCAARPAAGTEQIEAPSRCRRRGVRCRPSSVAPVRVEPLAFGERRGVDSGRDRWPSIGRRVARWALGAMTS